MRDHRIDRRIVLVALTLCAFVSAGAQISLAAETHTFANGIRATVHGADEIAAALQDNGKALSLVHPVVGRLALDQVDGQWFPFDEDIVVQALEAMHGFETRVDVEIFILPAPPAEIGSSFARRDAIYLAPGSGEVAPSTVAYITAHEMGHVLTWAFLDGHDARWDAYLQTRDLGPENLSADARHADRAREILAEDVRFLYGGPLATRGGSIENHDLITPNRVEGLEELLTGFFQAPSSATQVVTARAFPNPCNPLTTIQMSLDRDPHVLSGAAELRVYDVRGALVRTVQGGHVANGRISIQWNGQDDFGGAVASGHYFYLLRAGQNVGKGAVVLVR